MDGEKVMGHYHLFWTCRGVLLGPISDKYSIYLISNSVCVPQEKITIMRTNERYWWWVKEKKQMALVLFMIVTLMLQLQMKGCVGCLETERMGLLQLKSYLKNGFEVEKESMMKSWSHDDPSSDCCHWERVKCSDATGGHVVHLSLNDLILASYALKNQSLNLSLMTSYSLNDLILASYALENQSLNLSLLHSFPRLQSLDLSFGKFSDLFDPINGTVLVSFRESHPFILLALTPIFFCYGFQVIRAFRNWKS